MPSETDDRWENFLRDVKRSGPAPVSLLYGDDEHLRRLGVEAILAARPGADVFRYDAAGTSPARVRGDLGTPSLLGAATVVVLRGSGDQIGAFREVAEEFLDVAPPNAHLVCVVEGAAGRARFPKSGRGRLARAACEAPRGRELVRWVQDAAAAKGRRIAPDAAEALVQRTGEDLGRLDGHLEKLRLYVGTRTLIRAEDVEAVVGQDRSFDAFHLVRATTSGRRREAIEILHRLLEQGDAPEMILGALAWQIRRLIEGRSLLRAGRVPAEIGQALKLRGYFLDEFLRLARESRDEILIRRHAAILRADAAVKRGRLVPDFALEVMVLELCGKKAS